MKITHDSNPDPNGDWADRLVNVWTEDDATMHMEDHESVEDAWKRIRGGNLYSEVEHRSQVLAKDDRGDWCATLHPDGWVAYGACDGGGIARVAKMAEETPPSTEGDDKRRGLYGKYSIFRVDGGNLPGRKHENCDYFTLDLVHDPLAIPALFAYAVAADGAGYHHLAQDLRLRLIGMEEQLEVSGPLSVEDKLHLWFELSYAQYLTLPRSILLGMPVHWRNRLAGLMDELDLTFDWRPKDGRYRVQLMSEVERYNEAEKRDVTHWDAELPDPLMEYRHSKAAVEVLRRG